MTAQFEEKPLFGGAITGTIPQGWLDASDIRQVPNHQEIFLSPTTLSNLIIEINEYVPKQQALRTLSSAPESLSQAGAAAHVGAEAEGVAAALYHLRDLCDEGDTMDIINPPHPVQLKHFTAVNNLSAFTGIVKYTTPKKQRSATAGINALGREDSAQQQTSFTSIDGDVSGGRDTASSSTTGPWRSSYSSHFLLVRLPEKETDILVFVNVPHDEFDLQGDPRALAREEAIASGLLEKFVEVLEVKNWDLFG
ncbi:putative Ran-interacting protein Mog1 [Talaromyces proteolyticus]|uniref:Ran-interacting protein Mog1 n=1 Tax=Talaromyces proteolyticus TaxID=1131652 RepID=A0AAD4L0N2_9EURO|nr:putative Ran-interacting protein Mog1 [Talaromyces proteolyticus]KAH8701700.1 putative Ran-interacting protein Mog1 [Talaromyces proteolyticus]